MPGLSCIYSTGATETDSVAIAVDRRCRLNAEAGAANWPRSRPRVLVLVPQYGGWMNRRTLAPRRWQHSPEWCS